MQPHHYESQDAYHERRAAFALGLLFDQPWGISDLDLNSDSLQAGEVGIRRFEGIFPDGTPLSISGVAGANVLQRSFEATLRQKSTVDVFLGIVRQVPGKALVDAADGSTEPRRFARRLATRPELETGQNPGSVPWLRPNVRILFEGEAVEEYAVLRIGQLLKGPNGKVVYTRKIVPPVLRIQASAVLRDMLQELHQRLVETRDALVARRPEGHESTASDAARVVLRMMLGRAVPRVADLHQGHNVHPRQAYSALVEIVGALAPFGTQATVTIPPFDILRLGPTFADLTKHAHDILASITASRYRAIPLNKRAIDGVRFGDLHEPGIFSKDFVIAVRGSDPARLRMELPHFAKVAALDVLGALLNNALGGIGIAAISRPAGLEVPPQTVCFRLDQHGDQWEELVRRGTIAIHLPEAYKDSDVTLHIKEPGALT